MLTIPMDDTNFNEISRLVCETNEPIDAEFVIQSAEVSKDEQEKIAKRVIKSIEYIKNGGKTIPVREAIARMEKKYGVKFV